jgi:hypothetical protein
MGSGRRGCAVLLACALAAPMASTGVASAAATHSCGTRSVGRYYHLRVHLISCRRAAHKLRVWSSKGHHIPDKPVGLWYCDMKRKPKLCTRGNGNAPYFTFRKRRRARSSHAP